MVAECMEVMDVIGVPCCGEGTPNCRWPDLASDP
jgi:hypothetical protein